jgi:RNA polymerase sigma factor (sigma-70 family)
MTRARPAAKAGEPDERLLIESAKRDPRQFAELYENNFDRVYSYVVSRVRDRSEAQDLTAEVFHQALANLGRFEWRGVPFVAWLYRMAANAIVDRAQHIAREQTIDADAPDETDLEDVEQRAQIFRLVEELPGGPIQGRPHALRGGTKHSRHCERHRTKRRSREAASIPGIAESARSIGGSPWLSAT